MPVTHKMDYVPFEGQEPSYFEKNYRDYLSKSHSREKKIRTMIKKEWENQIKKTYNQK